MKDSYKEIFKDVNNVLVVLAHPDDAEVFAGGTVARLAEDGKKVTLISVTNGDRGSRENIISSEELVKARNSEDLKSLEAYGLPKDSKVFLNFIDGEVENSLETIEAIVKTIRIYKPDLIITHNPQDVIIKHSPGNFWVNHRDHRNIGMSVVDAAYPYSRDTLFFPHHFDEYGSHTCVSFLFVDNFTGEDIVGIDVSNYMDQKIDALCAHESQFSKEDAEGLCDFMTKVKGTDKRFERFKFVQID